MVETFFSFVEMTLFAMVAHLRFMAIFFLSAKRKNQNKERGTHYDYP